MKSIIGVWAIVLGLAGGVAAATVTVDGAGSGDYLTIQEGIDAAGPGDTVLVQPGTYTGAGNRDLDFGGTNLVLVSSGGYAVTTLDCENAARGFVFSSCEDTTAVVRGFTIANAAADSGAGAFLTKGSDPRFEACLFLNNTASDKGGGLCCVSSSPVVRNCRFEQNTVGGGTLAAGGGAQPASVVYPHGGGMACLDGSSPVIEDTDFDLNVAGGGGGGLYCYQSPPECVRCDFTGNNLSTYGNAGGAVALSSSDGAVFTDCTFRGNGAAETITGAGLYASSSDVTITDCAFMDNTAGSAAGLNLVYGSSGTITDCTFAGNTATWGCAAAGLRCFSGSDATITNCTFADNNGDHIWCQEASPTIEYSILAYSTCGIAVRCEEGTETPLIHHCFVYGNAASDTLCGGNFHDIVNADPLFCDMAGEDFTLCQDSPCLPGATWPSLAGAEGEGCPACGNAVEPTTWGSLKALYH